MAYRLAAHPSLSSGRSGSDVLTAGVNRRIRSGRLGPLFSGAGLPPNPTPTPVPGPLDFVENSTGLSQIVVEYDLARPVAMLGVVFRHSGTVTSMTATHGGEALELTGFILDDVDNIGAATFIANTLTIEPANLVITPVGGGTIGPAVGRVDDSFAIDDVAVGIVGTRFGASYIGASTQPVPVVFDPVSGDGWGVYALASAGAEQPSYAIGWNGAAPTEVLFGAPASSGTLGPVPAWSTIGAGWTEDGDWWAHDGAPYTSLLGGAFPSPVPNPFWYEIEVDVPDGSRLYVKTVGGAGFLRQTFTGPVAGVFRIYRHQAYLATSFQIEANGGARFRNFQICDNGETIYGAFGRTVNVVPDGSSLQFKIGALSRYAGVAMEVHAED